MGLQRELNNFAKTYMAGVILIVFLRILQESRPRRPFDGPRVLWPSCALAAGLESVEEPNRSYGSSHKPWAQICLRNASSTDDGLQRSTALLADHAPRPLTPPTEVPRDS